MSPELSEPMIYIQNLTERVNKHSHDLSEGLDKIFNKLEEIKDNWAKDKLDIYRAINEVKEISMRDNHKLSAKVALLTGAIGIASGGIGSLAMEILNK